MSVGFRKGLFGFNCDDVTEYVQKTHKEFSEKKIELNEKIENLNTENISLKEQLNLVNIEKAEIEAKLKEFTDKYDEIERLSKNIGKLYLVAKSNAETIMKEAQTGADIARREAQKNIDSIMIAHKSLGNVKEDIVNTSAKFAKDINALESSLYEAKSIIETHEAAAIKSEEDYRELIKVLSND